MDFIRRGEDARLHGRFLSTRTEHTSVFWISPFSNRLVWAGIATELALLGLLLYVPVLRRLFGTAPLSLQTWMFLLAWTPILLITDEGRKVLVRRRACETLHSRVRAST